MERKEQKQHDAILPLGTTCLPPATVMDPSSSAMVVVKVCILLLLFDFMTVSILGQVGWICCCAYKTGRVETTYLAPK